MASSPFVTSEKLVDLSSSYHNIISLKVPIAEAESESESESDHDDDEELSDEEKSLQVTETAHLVSICTGIILNVNVFKMKRRCISIVK